MRWLNGCSVSPLSSSRTLTATSLPTTTFRDIRPSCTSRGTPAETSVAPTFAVSWRPFPRSRMQTPDWSSSPPSPQLGLRPGETSSRSGRPSSLRIPNARSTTRSGHATPRRSGSCVPESRSRAYGRSWATNAPDGPPVMTHGSSEPTSLSTGTARSCTCTLPRTRPTGLRPSNLSPSYAGSTEGSSDERRLYQG